MEQPKNIEKQTRLKVDESKYHLADNSKSKKPGQTNIDWAEYNKLSELKHDKSSFLKGSTKK